MELLKRASTAQSSFNNPFHSFHPFGFIDTRSSSGNGRDVSWHVVLCKKPCSGRFVRLTSYQCPYEVSAEDKTLRTLALTLVRISYLKEHNFQTCHIINIIR